MKSFLRDPSDLLGRIEATFNRLPPDPNPYERSILKSGKTSAVLFLLGLSPEDAHRPVQPCIILNKRSRLVKQPGDLCFPGGSASMPVDALLARLLVLPGSPLRRWASKSIWQKRDRATLRILASLLATGLRESFEEMRLNPFRVRFFGPMLPQNLVAFDRTIYPMVCWAEKPKRLKINSEVEKILYVPLEHLLTPDNYARYRIYLASNRRGEKRFYKELPCFLHRNGDTTEHLWGATYRMVVDFLRLVFDFSPPPEETMSVVEGTLDRKYLGR